MIDGERHESWRRNWWIRATAIASAVMFFRLHLDLGECLSFSVIVLCWLGAGLSSIALIVYGLARLSTSALRKLPVRRDDLAHALAGVTCLLVSQLPRFTDVEERLFHWWHLPSYERFLEKETDVIPGDHVLVFETQVVFVYRRMMGIYCVIHDEKPGRSLRDLDSSSPRPIRNWPETSFWERFGEEERARAFSLGGCWYGVVPRD